MLDVAVRNNDIKKVKELLDSGVPAEPKNKKGWTPLMIAVVGNKSEIADLLLSRGANIHATNKSQSILHLVARYGKNDMVEYLLKRGLNAKRRDWLSWTPLMWASLQGKNDMVETFVSYGANVNVTDVDNNTPLMLAVWRGHKDTAMLLVSYNVNVLAVNKEGLTAAGIAKKHEFHELAKELDALAKKNRKK
ncbi:MAG: ankyrin repeat domain-containing protein, partial [Elusimicrobiota bacterium]|nr:ankyrin repeat domain-containing protein [Elusimicrobiota bacterium]